MSDDAVASEGEIRFRGKPVASGIAIGTTFHVQRRVQKVSCAENSPLGAEEEIARYRRAVDASIRDLEQLKGRLQSEGAVEGAAILDCHLQLMQDPALTTEIEQQIRETEGDAAFLFQEAMTKYELKFRELPDDFRERLNDVKDVAGRILRGLHASSEPLSQVPHQAVVFAEELFPSDTVAADPGTIAALVTRSGGSTSHLAIMAKSLGIPYVSGIDFASLPPSSAVIVDGRTGEVILNPSEGTLSKYREAEASLRAHRIRLEEGSAGEACTRDGHPIGVSANIQMIQELERLHRAGGSGVGLFRSEYLFLSRSVFPTEEEQFPIYRELVERAKGLPVVIRTFDVGGDKFDRLPHVKRSDHPFLSSRSIRFMLDHQEAFRAQLRAILRASVAGNVRMLFPMVSDLEEMLEARRCVDEVKASLRGEGIPFDEEIPIGCMIEIPSAALTVDLMAEHCDFFSIGTNDLVQYTLAVDRASEERLQGTALAHPALVRLLGEILQRAGETPVTVCGEMAADPRFSALLIGLGVSEFSVAPPHLPLIKEVVRRTHREEAQRLASEVRSLTTHEAVLARLTDHYKN